MRKQFDRAAAEAFACLTPIQSACYHYMTDNFSEHHKITLRNYFMPVLLLQGIKPKYSPPHRRLRKSSPILKKVSAYSPPHRRLRKCAQAINPHTQYSPPHRRLRKVKTLTKKLSTFGIQQMAILMCISTC